MKNPNMVRKEVSLFPFYADKMKVCLNKGERRVNDSGFSCPKLCAIDRQSFLCATIFEIIVC
jgi:hypothetical protein